MDSIPPPHGPARHLDDLFEGLDDDPPPRTTAHRPTSPRSSRP